MNALFNRHIINQDQWDSGEILGFSVVAHPFPQAGYYHLTILQDDQPISQLGMRVQPAAAPEGAQQAAVFRGSMPEMQTHIDLAQIHNEQRGVLALEAEAEMQIQSKGYAVFHTSSGTRGYAVVAAPASQETSEQPFDSRQLGEGDYYAVTLMRPGTYAVTNAISGAEAKITVAYPTIGATPYRPPDAISIECTDQGFEPKTVDLKPAQGVIFRIHTAARIHIRLAEPDDGPQRAAPNIRARTPKASWRKRR